MIARLSVCLSVLLVLEWLPVPGVQRLYRARVPVHCVLVVLAEICLAQRNEISRSVFPGKSWKKTLKDFIWLPPGRFYSPGGEGWG